MFSRWTMQAIADDLIRLEVVDYITDSTVCEVMKKNELSRGCKGMVHSKKADADFVAKMKCVGGISSVLRPVRPLSV